MTRPKKEETLAKTKDVHLRMNETEYDLLAERAKANSNLNQIARYFNQGGILSSEMRNEIRKSLRDIYEMKYKVMKMAGDFRGSN